MSIAALRRVLWRVRTKNPNNPRPTYNQLERAIMHECGTSRYTYHANRKALIKLGWIKAYNSVRFTLTNFDLEDS